MEVNSEILVNLKQFVKKYYLNELLRGFIFFTAIGLLYFLFTLLIEYLFWLPPSFRGVLFWLFVCVEVILFYKFIVISIVKLLGFTKTISLKEAAVIIGNHFPEIEDKLLNLLQLSESKGNSELINATIIQKSNSLKPFSFPAAINFKQNSKYFRFALTPFALAFFIYVSGYGKLFTNSFERVIHYKKIYVPPAPFEFVLLNKNLQVIEGNNITFEVTTNGDVVPEYMSIIINEGTYIIEKQGFNKFKYTAFENFDTTDFYFESNGYKSKKYRLNVVKIPQIKELSLLIKYPLHINKEDELINNTGNAVVPEGSIVTWRVKTRNTGKVAFNELNFKEEKFKLSKNDVFEIKRTVTKNLNYQLKASNLNLKNYEVLDYKIEVIPDEFPIISVESDIDSITYKKPQFAGIATDDYGITQINFVYYLASSPKNISKKSVRITKGNVCNFYYVIDDFLLQEGNEYRMYFEVFDNDAINQPKSTRSKEFSFKVKTKSELNQLRNNELESQMNQLNENVKKENEIEQSLINLKKNQINAAKNKWENNKELNDIIKRIEESKKERFKEIERLQNNIDRFDENKNSKELQAELNKRLEELKEKEKNDALLDELKKFQDKLTQEELIEKLDELSRKNKSKQQNLERLLELTKKFYIEQKLNEIGNKLLDVSYNQKELSKQPLNKENSNSQKAIQTSFKKAKSNFLELKKVNNTLVRPVKLEQPNFEFNEIESDLEQLMQDFEKSNGTNTSKKQREIGKKIEALGNSLVKNSGSSDSEMIEENIDDLRKIVENLIEFSFTQETVYGSLANKENSSDISEVVSEQKTLKKYFEHIDDSLYVLSLRLVKMSNGILDKVNLVHYNIDKTSNNLSELKIDQALSNQKFVITYANDLGNLLSDLLENLMNSSPKFGKGQGKSSEFSLPDIIKKQGDLQNQFEKELNNTKGKGEKGKEGRKEENEGQTDSVYEMYKQQELLKDELNKLFEQYNISDGIKEEVIKPIEELQEELIKKGLTNEGLNKFKQLEYQFLKLEEAILKQGIDSKKESTENTLEFNSNNLKEIEFKKKYFNSMEILNRQLLPLQSGYAKKVVEYFNQKNE